jgi:hypothetical protein
MVEERNRPEIEKWIRGGYSPERRGYQPTEGNLDVSNPPQGGSGVPQTPSSSSEESAEEE